MKQKGKMSGKKLKHTEGEIARLNEILVPLVKQGQSIHQIYLTHKDCNYICNFLQKADLDTVRTYRLAQAKKIIGLPACKCFAGQLHKNTSCTRIFRDVHPVSCTGRA